MLVGDPDRFAIWLDAVESWSTDYFDNGCLAYLVGGRTVVSFNSTLNSDISLLSSMCCMGESVQDCDLFSLPASLAFSKLVERAFPQVDSGSNQSDYKHVITVGSLLDEGCRAFLIEESEKAKIIMCEGKINPEITEIILVRGEFQEVVSKAVEAYDTFVQKKRWRS